MTEGLSKCYVEYQKKEENEVGHVSLGNMWSSKTRRREDCPRRKHCHWLETEEGGGIRYPNVLVMRGLRSKVRTSKTDVLLSNTQHLSNSDHLEDKVEDYQTVLCCIMYHTVNSDMQHHPLSSLSPKADTYFAVQTHSQGGGGQTTPLPGAKKVHFVADCSSSKMNVIHLWNRINKIE